DGSYSLSVATAELKADKDTVAEVSVAAKDPATGKINVAGNSQDYTVENDGTNGGSGGGTNTSGKTVALVIDPVTADNLINAAEASATNTTITGKVHGVFTAGDKVTLTVNNLSTYSATVNGLGEYSIDVKTSDLLADSDTQIEGSVTTSAGVAKAIQNYGVDTVVPNGGKALGLAIDTDTNNDGWINRKELGADTSVKVTATFDAAKAEVGDKVTFTDSATNAQQTVTLDAAAIAAGKVSASFAAPAEGVTFSVKAVLQDGAGNATPEASDSAKRDTSNFGPVDPNVDPANADKNISIEITSDL
ncbi:hypothetical protein B9Z48_21505, partial [Limnohabitans sp. WS1]